MIRCVETGRNPTMRYLHRTHRCSVAWLHESFERDDLQLVYEKTARMCADIYTKAFTDPAKWQIACWLINIIDTEKLNSFLVYADSLRKPSAVASSTSVIPSIQDGFALQSGLPLGGSQSGGPLGDSCQVLASAADIPSPTFEGGGGYSGGDCGIQLAPFSSLCY